MKQKRDIYLLLLLLLLPIASTWGYKSEKIYINSGGKQRNMLVYTPDVLPDNSPLFITTHGMGGSSENQAEHDRMYELVDTAKFVMCYPRADGDYWDISGTSDQNFIIKVIDEMATRYKINRNRVYWSGFSMGSMLLFHCMPNMLNKIAAFAPTSGIQFSESPWERCSKKVNVMECIAYNDNAFNYNKYGIRSYMENFGKMNQYTKYEKVSGYRTKNGTSWFDGDRELWLNEETKHEVVLYSYNYSGKGSHTPVAENSYEIWNFCKRFQLGDNIIVTPTLKEARDAFLEAMNAAREAYEGTVGDDYATAEPLRANVKEQIDKYDGFESTDSTAYLLPTRSINSATEALVYRKENLDNYFAARERVKTLIDQYADRPSCNHTATYLRMVSHYEYYDLPEKYMVRDAKLITATEALTEIAERFVKEIATVIRAIRSSPAEDRAAVFDLGGRHSDGKSGIRIINGKKFFVR